MPTGDFFQRKSSQTGALFFRDTAGSPSSSIAVCLPQTSPCVCVRMRGGLQEDEASPCQALARLVPALPCGPGSVPAARWQRCPGGAGRARGGPVSPAPAA